jgi:exodeoxyribonuclease VII small subunit
MADEPDIKTLSFEKALALLEEIVAKLESGKVDLEESIKIYERGESLRKHCETKLAEAEARIEKITLGANGKPTGTAPLDVE